MLHKKLPKFHNNSYAHFVTTNTYKGYAYFGNERLASVLKEELVFYVERYGFDLLGYVIMPDHFHLLIWWDVETRPGLTISRIMNSFKTMTSKRIKRELLYGGDTVYWGRLADVSHLTL